MSQPSFYSDGPWPRNTDSFHVLLLKFWGILVDSGYDTTNPVRTSTSWNALKRITEAASRQVSNEWFPSIRDPEHVLIKKMAYVFYSAFSTYREPTKQLTNRDLLFNIANQLSVTNIRYRDTEWSVLYKIVHKLYFDVYP